MKVKEQAVGVDFAASTDEINKTLDFLLFLEPSIESKKDLTSKIIKQSEPLHHFIEAHCNIMFFKQKSVRTVVVFVVLIILCI